MPPDGNPKKKRRKRKTRTKKRKHVRPGEYIVRVKVRGVMTGPPGTKFEPWEEWPTEVWPGGSDRKNER